MASGAVPFSEYLSTLKKGSALAGLHWLLRYKGIGGTKITLRNAIAQHKDAAIDYIPKVVSPYPSKRELLLLKTDLAKYCTTLGTFVSSTFRGHGSIIGTSIRYTMDNIYGRIDAVLKDGNGRTHFLKLTDQPEIDIYSDLVALDILAFTTLYSRPSYAWLVDIKNFKKIPVDTTPNSGILNELQHIAANVENAANYKIPGPQCIVCPFRKTCDQRR